MADLLESADRAGRQRDHEAARQYYLLALANERFNWPAANQDYPDLDMRMAASFILSGDLDNYVRLCQHKESAVGVSRLAISARTLLLHPSAPSLNVRLPGPRIDEQPPDYWKLDLEGRVLLRAGRYEKALAVLKTLARWDRKNEALQAVAMAATAAQRLALDKEAQSFLLEAQEGLARIVELNEGRYEQEWHQQAAIELLLNEARALVDEKETSD